MNSTLRNILRGVFVGCVIATGFSIWVTVLGIVGGKGRFENLGVTWFQTIALYYATIPLGGAAVGSLLFLRRWLAGSIFLGFLAALPLYAAVHLLTQGTLTADSLIRAAIIAGAIGGAGGASVWWQEVRKRKRGTKSTTVLDPSIRVRDSRD